MRITKENTLGLVIDIQERLVPAMGEQELFLASAKKLITGLAELEISMVVSQQYPNGLGQTLPEVASLIPNYAPIDKTDFSCWDVSEIQEAITAKEGKNIIICGIESHVCVLQTAVDMKAAGLNPIIVVDAVDSRKALDKSMAIERFKSEGILIVTVEQILFELTRGAKAPAFKAISKIIR